MREWFAKQYARIPNQLKISFWFATSIFIQKGMAIISIPIFTRIMSEEDYGKYGVFNSWLGIVSVIITINLFSGMYVQGLVKFSDESETFASSIQGLNITLCLIWTLVYLLFRDFFNRLLDLDTLQMSLMIISIWLSAIFSFWSVEQRVLNTYKSLVVVSFLSAFLQLLLGVVFVLLMREDAVTARIVSVAISYFLCYFWIFVKRLSYKKSFFHRKFWMYALKFNIPLIPHYLSSIVLTSSDRIMISKLTGDYYAGIYGLAYSIASLVMIANIALIQTIEPWLYNQIKKDDTPSIPKVSFPAFLIIIMLNVFVIALAPEIVGIFAPASYYEAIYVIPPISMSVFFIFVYTFFGTFEFYYEKTIFVSLATVLGALLNVVLNYLFIPIYGYRAAGYTTLICYIVYSTCHYIFSRLLVKKNSNNPYPYGLRKMLAITIPFVLIGFLFLLVYDNRALRWVLIALLSILLVIFRKKILHTFTQIRGIKNG